MKKIILTLASAAMLWGCAAQAQETTPAPVAAAPPAAAAPAPAAAGSRVMMLRVTVSDTERAANFYRDVFGAVGMQGMMGPPPGAAGGAPPRGGGVRIMTLPGGMPGLILIPGGADDNMRSSWVMQVPNLEATLANAQAHGATVNGRRFVAGEGGFSAQPGGAQSNHILDPDGNDIEVLQMGGLR